MRQPSPRVTLAEMPLPRPPSSPLNPQGSQGLQAARLASEALPTRCAWGRGWSPAAGGGRSGAATRAKGTGYQGRECSELPALLVLLPLRKPQEALGPKLPGLHRGRLRSHSRLGPSRMLKDRRESRAPLPRLQRETSGPSLPAAEVGAPGKMPTPRRHGYLCSCHSKPHAGQCNAAGGAPRTRAGPRAAPPLPPWPGGRTGATSAHLSSVVPAGRRHAEFCCCESRVRVSSPILPWVAPRLPLPAVRWSQPPRHGPKTQGRPPRRAAGLPAGAGHRVPGDCEPR